MDIIRQYYDHEILITREQEGWSWVLSLCVESSPIVIASSNFFPTPFTAEQTAINGLKTFFACYALLGFIGKCKTKRLISHTEYELLKESIANCEFDL